MYWDRGRVRERLLQRSLRHAWTNVPYYRDLLGDNVDPYRLELSDFEFTDPAVFKADPRRFFALDSFPESLLCTGGTSGKPRGVIVSTGEEADAAYRFKTGIRPDPRMVPDIYPGLVVELTSSAHGTNTRPRPGLQVLRMPLSTYSQAQVTHSLLRNGLPVRGRVLPVVGITGNINQLRLLTRFLQVESFDMAASSVGVLVSFAWHLSDHWRDELAETWNAKVMQRYGLTEFGLDVPVECDHCGCFHFQISFVEYIHPNTRSTVEEGCAELCLTSLVPFKKSTPLVRYLTGDLVEIGEPCEHAAGDRGCRFVGRIQDCVVREDRGLCRSLLAPTDLIEVMDAMEGLATWEDLAPRFFQTGPTKSPPDEPIGRAVFHWSVSPGPVDADAAELVLESTLPSSEHDRVRNLLMDGLARRSPALLAELDRGGLELVVRVVPEGYLEEQGLKRCLV